jgi:hypothetical protein
MGKLRPPTPEEIQEDIDRENAYKDLLKSLGYKLDGSRDDWYLLMNNTVIFGDNWKTHADYNFEHEDFLKFVKQYIK